MELTETTYVVAMWSAPTVEGDVLITLYRDDITAPLRLVIRTRIDRGSPDPFDDTDDKYTSVLELGRGVDEEGLLRSLDELVRGYPGIKTDRIDKVIIRGGASAVQKALANKPWAHFRWGD